MPSFERTTSVSPRLLQRALALGQFILEGATRSGLLAFFLLVLGSFTEGVSLLLLVPLVDLLARSSAQSFSVSVPPAVLSGVSVHLDLTSTLVGFAVLVSASALFSRYKLVFMSRLLFETINRLRLELFSSITKARWSKLLQLKLADIDHALTGDIDRVQAAVTALLMVAQCLVFLAFYTAISALISLRLTVIAVLGGVAIFFAMRAVRAKAAELGATLTRERKRQYRTISDFLAALKVTKAFAAEGPYLRRLEQTLATMRDHTLSYVGLVSSSGAITQIVGVVLACVFILVAHATFAVPFARIMVILLVFMRIAPRFKDLQDQIQPLVLNLPAFESMLELKQACDVDAEQAPRDETSRLELSNGVRFEHVGFAIGRRDIIQDLCFDIPAGQITALVGVSGSGKSTIADLAMGLLVPTDGRILVDGNVLNDDNRLSWRMCIGFVPQDTFLLPATIAENLALGVIEAETGSVWRALSQANAEAFVRALPGGLEAAVGQGGVILSGGERQRLAIARALLRKPYFLVLDEATSALDLENTEVIKTLLRSLRGQTTILMITHNPSLLDIADQTLTIDNGRLQGIESNR